MQAYACTIMREWLSGGAPPCQGGGRGFDSRLALLMMKGDIRRIPPFLLAMNLDFVKATY